MNLHVTDHMGWQAKEREQELLAEAYRLNEVTQVLKAEAGLVSLVHPLSAKQFSSKPIKSLGLKVEIESQRPIKTVYSPTHEIDISRPNPRKAVVGFEASDVVPETDFQLFFSAEEDEVDLGLAQERLATPLGRRGPRADQQHRAGKRLRARLPGADGARDGLPFLEPPLIPARTPRGQQPEDHRA
jgi:hypothetical protein